MLRKILAPLCLTALAGCDSGSSTIIQTDQAQLSDPIPGPAVTARLVTLPGRIEAEDFISQNGIRLGDTNDSGNSQFVGHIENNDYVEYDIDAPSSGTYDLLARVGSLTNNATVNVIANGQNAGSFNVSPTGGWEVWETVSTTVNLSEGRQTLRLQFSGNANGLMNINWFSLALADEDTTTSPPPPPPPTGTDIELGSDRWTVTANQNSDDAFLAIDDNDNTRWTTGQAQQSGQQFTIDFNSTQTFDRLVLDSSDSNDDYPRDYEVEVSNNGSQWSTVAAGTGTSNGITVIDFADQSASHLRVNQLGSANRNWWSIHELALFANSSDTPPEEVPPVEEPEVPDTPIDGEILSHDFNDGTMGPFVACTVKSPNYTRAENGRVKTYWTEAGFDGTRTSRGSEFCDADRSDNELKTRDEGSMGFTVNVDTGHSRTSHSALAQVFGFNLARDQFSWSGLLELQDGDLVVEHRNCLCDPTSVTIVENFEYGRDHDIVIEFKVSDQRRGKFKVWVDNELMYNATDINFGFGDFSSDDVQINQSFTTFKLGMYNHSDGDYRNNEERIVYYDDVTWYNGKNGFNVVNPR